MCRPKQNGFTLAEVLTSVFLLALGIVGAAGMQLQALRTAQQSAFQTHALSLATEIADAMRMTLSAPQSHALVKPYLRIDFRAGKSTSGHAPACYVQVCTAEQLVAFNIDQWQRRIEAGLPEARARICLDMQPRAPTAEPDWNCRLPANAGESAPIVVKIGWRDKTRPPSHDGSNPLPQELPPRLVMTIAPYLQ